MKKALSIVLALMMVLSTVSLAAPTMVSTVTDANETSVDATEIEKTTLASTTSEAATFKPGVNILTGTEEAFNFDNDAYTLAGTGNRNVYLDGEKIFVLSDGTASITESPVAGESTNKALKMGGIPVEAGKTSYPQVINFAGSLPEGSRPVFVGIKTLVANGDNVASGSSGSGLRVGANNSTTAPYANGNYTYVNLYTSTQTPTAWLNYGTMDKVSTTALPRFVYNIKAVESAATVDIYMDDIYMTPYYKVTYMNGTTELGTAYVLDDGNGNILDSFDPSEFDDAITMPEGKNAWSLTNGGKATHDVELNNEDIIVYAVLERNFTPGINILTGTEDALNFNNMQNVTVTDGSLKDAEGNLVLTYDKSAAATLSVVDSPVSSQDGKVIKLGDYPLNTKNPYPKVYFNNYKMPEDGRPVLITYKALVLNADNCSNAGMLNDKGGINFNWIIYGDSTNSNAGLNSYLSTATTYEWRWSVHAYDKTKTSETKYSKPGYIQGSVAVANGTGFTKDDLQPNHYFDDISFVPYYKVTYMNGDTKLGEAWVLDDSKGKILDSFNPVDYFEGEYPAGTNAWSLTKGGKAVESIALENEDITVYATWGAKNTDNVVLSLDYNDGYEFNSDHTISRVSHHSIKDGKLIAAANIPSGVKPDNSVYKYDSIMGFRNLGLDGTKIKKFVMRAKFVEAERAEEATYLYDENGNIVYNEGTTEPVLNPADQNYIWRKDDLDKEKVFHNTFIKSGVNVPFEIGDTLIDSAVEFHFQVPGDSNYYKTKMKSFTSAMADEEGFVTLVFDVETDMYNDTHKEKWQNNEISYFRFDFPAVCCAAEIDYIRFYGDEGEKFAPLNDAPEKRDGNSIKFDEANNKTGIRYRAAIKKDVKEKKALTEYGWLVALAQTLDNEELTHEFKSSNGKASYVEGVAYGYDSKVGKNVDRIYEIEDDHVVFTAVVVGVPVDKAEMEIVIRPYSIVNGAYVYGNSVITSPREVAQRIKDKNGDDYKNHAEFIEALLGNRQEA